MATPGWIGRSRRILRRGSLAALALLGPLAMAPAFHARAEASLPAGFTDTVVTSGLGRPTALAVVANGHANAGDIYVASQEGILFLVPGDGGAATPALDLTGTTCDDGEQGLLGVALDPGFAANNRVFLYVTEREGPDCFNRVYRYTAGGDGTLDPGSGTRLLSTASLQASNHNGGDIHFGADGFLYVSVGENARRDLAQGLDTLFGKILRIDANGNAPQDNPFAGRAGAESCAGDGEAAVGGTCSEIYALGLRNPFRFAFDEAGTRFLINDVGEATWEEIDPGMPGANYGWPKREGPCPTGESRACKRNPKRFIAPVFAYGRTGGCRTITGGAFVPQGSGWGNREGRYLYADFACDRIFTLAKPFGKKPKSRVFASGVGVIALQFDPTNPGDLLYTTFNNSGEVRRISP